MKVPILNCKLKFDSAPVGSSRVPRKEPVEFNTGQI